MDKSKRREKKRRRHDRQIADGTRHPRDKNKRRRKVIVYKRTVKLSELDPGVVMRVLQMVRTLRI